MAPQKISPERRFKNAVEVIQSLPKEGPFQPSNDQKLKFYGYYKQVTEGPCTAAKPSFWDVVGVKKWEAWNRLGNMPKEEAMELYVEELLKIIETMPHSDDVDRFMKSLNSGNPYNLVVETEETHEKLSSPNISPRPSPPVSPSSKRVPEPADIPQLPRQVSFSLPPQANHGERRVSFSDEALYDERRDSVSDDEEVQKRYPASPAPAVAPSPMKSRAAGKVGVISYDDEGEEHEETEEEEEFLEASDFLQEREAETRKEKGSALKSSTTVAATVARLQQELNDTVARITVLERAVAAPPPTTAAQLCRKKHAEGQGLFGLTPAATAFVVAWPVVTALAFSYFSRPRHRR
eukprot:Colp12_sorted_trinity150504_noHs@13535